MKNTSTGMASFLFVGPLVLTAGLRSLWHARRINSIPASDVRFAAAGLVQLHGKARPRKQLVAPVSEVACCWWHCEVDEKQWNLSLSSRWPLERKWVTIRRISSPEVFCLEDATAKILVDPQGASMEVTEQVFSLDGPGLVRSLESLGFPHITASVLGEVRIREKVIPEDQPLYVAGELTRVAPSRPRVTLAMMAEAYKDGQVDSGEWDEFRLRKEEALLKEEVAQEHELSASDRVILRAPAKGPFLISDRSAKEVIRSLGWRATVTIIGGIGLCVVGVWGAVQAEWSPRVILTILGVALALSLPIVRAIGQTMER
jgi:hypothetical protein